MKNIFGEMVNWYHFTTELWSRDHQGRSSPYEAISSVRAVVQFGLVGSDIFLLSQQTFVFGGFWHIIPVFETLIAWPKLTETAAKKRCHYLCVLLWVSDKSTAICKEQFFNKGTSEAFVAAYKQAKL